MLDGARNALLGYLYQLLSLAASIVVRQVMPGDDAWAQLTVVVGSGQLTSEEFDQDAIVRTGGLEGDGIAAIQFKHSAAAGNRLRRSELIDIVAAFDQARTVASGCGEDITRFVLVSNRELGPAAQHLLDEARRSDVALSSLRLPTTRGGRPIAANVSKLARYGGDTAAAAAAWQSVLRALVVATPVRLEEALSHLRRFATQFGVLETEYDVRLNALVGALVMGTAERGTVAVTRTWLKEHLVGDPDAANLSFGSRDTPHLAALCRDVLSRRRSHLHRISEAHYLPRQAESDIREQLLQCPVVFVYGAGGCGKSLAVAECLKSMSRRQIVWSESAANATEAGIVSSIGDIRLPRRNHSDRSFRDLSARLRIANPGVPDVWTIDLDGVDETVDRRPEVRHLIRMCWAEGRREAAPVLLVVTCRHGVGPDAPRELLRNWLTTPEADLVQGVGFVAVGTFTDAELEEAALLLDGTPEARIVATINGMSTPGGPELAHEVLPDTLIESLRHPVVWGSYASLPESKRERVLNGDITALAQLAERLLERFFARCKVRRRWANEPNLEEAFAVAARAIVGPSPHLMEDWDKVCLPLLGSAEARWLHAEAAGYGLIHREGPTGWRWGHAFVVGHLESQRERGAHE